MGAYRRMGRATRRRGAARRHRREGRHRWHLHDVFARGHPRSLHNPRQGAILTNRFICCLRDPRTFKPKIELAMAMVERAVAAELPPGIVLADSFYGDASEFRAKIRSFNLDYAVAVERRTKVWQIDSLQR